MKTRRVPVSRSLAPVSRSPSPFPAPDRPEPIPADWTARVNAPLNQKERDRMMLSLKRSRPFGDDAWTTRTATRLDLKHTLRREGRRRKRQPNKRKGADDEN